MSDKRKLIPIQIPGSIPVGNADGDMRCCMVCTKNTRGRGIKRTARTLADARARCPTSTLGRFERSFASIEGALDVLTDA